jgi:hypothetical protein
MGFAESKPRRKESRRTASASETARGRRARRLDEERKKVRFVTERPRSERQPPVVARGRSYGMATPMRGTHQSRRRYDIAIGAIPGAEIRVPSVPTFNIGWRAVSGMMVVMMLFCLYMVSFSPYFKVEIVEIQGLKRLKPADVNLVLGITGDSILAVDPQGIENNLKQTFPDLSQAKVQLVLPATVRIHAVERTPVLRWVNDHGEFWVDQEGMIFPPRGDGNSLPLVQADILPGVTEEMLAILAGLRAPVPDEKGQVQSVRIEPALVTGLASLAKDVPEGQVLLFMEEHGFGWTDSHGWEVYFGTRLDDLKQKQVVYQALVDYLVNNGIHPALVSVEYVHAPYYRMER